ncbi:MAG: hypothetical protein LIO44_02735 [Eubacterium sp.]|nr:hypothetical protein [Eubacterium sp.]
MDNKPVPARAENYLEQLKEEWLKAANNSGSDLIPLLRETVHNWVLNDLEEKHV